MDFSKKLFSSLTKATHPAESQMATEDATAFSEESLTLLRSQISSPNIPTASMKENMLRLIYGEMMGEDVQFGAIYALQLAQSGQTVAEKRAGYLACSLLLQEGNELNIMLINTLQKDLTSSNYHHVVVALITLCNLTLTDVISSMVNHVLAVLSHSQESVRKRALIALKNFYIREPDLVEPYVGQIKDSLYDQEPSVMSAALGFFAVVVKDRARDMGALVPVLIKILKQVVEGKLPKGYSYHGMAAPWIQIRCLQIMAALGQDELSASQAMTPVVMAAFLKASKGVDAAFGILFETIRTLNTFHPEIILSLAQYKDPTKNPLLTIPRFATSSNQNLKYLGISMLCQVQPHAWSDTWWNDDLLSAVVQALESKDTAVQRRALELLYRMLTLENSENIIERLVHAFHQEQDFAPDQQQLRQKKSRKGQMEMAISHREKLLGQILDAAERFGKSHGWYLDLIFDLLERGGSTVSMQTAEKMMRVLERGASSPGIDRTELQSAAVQKSLQVLVTRDYHLSSGSDSDESGSQLSLAYFVLWVLGEFSQGDLANEDAKTGTTGVLDHLSRCLLVNQDLLIQAFVLSALTKVTLRMAPAPVPTRITGLVRRQILLAPSQRRLDQQPFKGDQCSTISRSDVHQRALEFLMVAELMA